MLETLTQAVQDFQKRAEARGKDIRDTKEEPRGHTEPLEAKGKNLEEAQKALIKYGRMFDAHTIEVRSIVLDKWARKPIRTARRSQRNAAALGG